MSDLDRLVELANNPKIACYMTDAFPNPYTREAGIKFINYANSHNPVSVFAIEYNGSLAGGIGVHPQTDIMRKNMELGYWIGEPYWGNGIATAAIGLIIPYAFKNFDINRIYARPFGTNIASQRVLEKSGFKKEARIEKNIFKNNEYLDELIYGYRK